jgi:BASS family bile acid:Na+ symporter
MRSAYINLPDPPDPPAHPRTVMPEANIITQIFLPLSLAFIMFTLGLALVVADFKRVTVQPKDFLVGLASQMLLLPAVAAALVAVWPMDPKLAVGVMLIAACPGGVTSNLMTHLARGDTALSVTLTAVISLISVMTLPLLVGLAFLWLLDAETMPRVSVLTTVLGIFAITVVPIAAGMAVRRWREGFALRFERIGRVIATVLFIVIVLGAIYAERANILAYFRQAGPAMLILNLIMMGLAFGLAMLFRLGRAQRRAIVLECGLQNGTLAIFVAGTLLREPAMMIPAGIYSLLMFVTGGVYMVAANRTRGSDRAVNAIS